METAVKPVSFIVMAMALLAILSAPFASSAQPAPASPAPAAASPAKTPSGDAASLSSGDRAYTLGVGDVIDGGVIGRTDFNFRARIGSDGRVVLPLLGAFPATDRSPGQLADEIRAALQAGGFYSQPVVRVEVVGVQSRFVTVLGAVSQPGLIPLDRNYRLSEVMARAGGAGSADYVILTRESGASTRYKVSEIATGTGDADPVVNSGDKIYVPALQNEVFYLTGAVKSPGAYPIAPDMSLRMALARGGGVSDMGSEKKVKVNRAGEYLKDVKLDETKVQAGDIVTVGERLF